MEKKGPFFIITLTVTALWISMQFAAPASGNEQSVTLAISGMT